MPPHGGPQASARSIKGRQRRHWRPLAATLLKSLPACILSVTSQDPFFWSFVDFCGRRKLFWVIWGRASPRDITDCPTLTCIVFAHYQVLGMYWGYTESFLVWLLYSFISNMVTYISGHSWSYTQTGSHAHSEIRRLIGFLSRLRSVRDSL